MIDKKNKQESTLCYNAGMSMTLIECKMIDNIKFIKQESTYCYNVDMPKQ